MVRSLQTNIQGSAESCVYKPVHCQKMDVSYFSLWTAIIAVNKMGGTHQSLVGGGLYIPQAISSEVSLKETSSSLCLLGIGTPKISNLHLAFPTGLVFLQSRLFLSPDASPETFAGLHRTPFIFTTHQSTGELQRLLLLHRRNGRWKINHNPY